MPEETTTSIWYTNAPEAYDYSYVKTVDTLRDASGWRKIEVSDEARFQNFQVPRYASGMYQVFGPESDLDDSSARDLPWAKLQG